MTSDLGKIAVKMDKVKKILKGSLDSISSPSPSVKIQNAGKFAWDLSLNESLFHQVSA